MLNNLVQIDKSKKTLWLKQVKDCIKDLFDQGNCSLKQTEKRKSGTAILIRIVGMLIPAGDCHYN